MLTCITYAMCVMLVLGAGQVEFVLRSMFSNTASGRRWQDGEAGAGGRVLEGVVLHRQLQRACCGLFLHGLVHAASRILLLSGQDRPAESTSIPALDICPDCCCLLTLLGCMLPVLIPLFVLACLLGACACRWRV